MDYEEHSEKMIHPDTGTTLSVRVMKRGGQRRLKITATMNMRIGALASISHPMTFEEFDELVARVAELRARSET